MASKRTRVKIGKDAKEIVWVERSNKQGIAYREQAGGTPLGTVVRKGGKNEPGYLEIEKSTAATTPKPPSGAGN